MKVDLHCHTDNTVKGDLKRYVEATKFRNIIGDNNIEVVAMTNHNKFLKDRYLELQEATSDIAMIWPGIELTVDAGNGERHMIIIASPKYVDDFDRIIKDLLGRTKADDVCIPLEKFNNLFDPLQVIYIVHYHDKTKKFYDSEIEKLITILTDKDLIFLEPTNITSMGIFLDHDMRSIIGSDVIDWDKYPINKIPELRLRIEDFECFRLLAQKDKRIVNKLLANEDSFKVHVEKHWNRDFLLYNDINIIFGGKGTGKSILAREIYTKLNLEKDKVKYFNSENSGLHYEDAIKVTFTDDEYKKFASSDMSGELSFIKEWTQSSPTRLKKYVDWGERKTAKELSDSFSFINMTYQGVIDDTDYLEYLSTFNDYTNTMVSLDNINLKDKVEESSIRKFKEASEQINRELLIAVNNKFIDLYTMKLVRKTIDIMKTAVLEKKQVLSKPESVGFIDYYTSRIQVVDKLQKFEEVFNKENKIEKTKLGEVENKGEVFLKKEIIINPISIIGVVYKSNFGKQKITKIINFINDCINSAFQIDFSEKLNDLVNYLEENQVTGINDFIGRKNTPTLEDLETIYEPSKGEKHMLALNNVILEDYKYFVLDEPTVGLGHEYVSNFILPQLKKLVKQGKTYIIVTHDANIGVRSLPYKSVYMHYDNNKKEFLVYEGNPFENVLYEINSKSNPLKWSSRAQAVLEGGELAFVERRKIYGKE
jgi:ABC-type cobalamin/Fe3+-siderophores transport system ATPase subunit